MRAEHKAGFLRKSEVANLAKNRKVDLAKRAYVWEVAFINADLYDHDFLVAIGATSMVDSVALFGIEGD